MDNVELQYYLRKLMPDLSTTDLVEIVNYAQRYFSAELDKFSKLDYNIQDKVLYVLTAIREGG